MKIDLKTREEFESMKEGGKRLNAVVAELIPQIEAGMTTMDVEKIAQELIRKHGGEPSFDKVPGYDWATCLCVNEQIVHTPPSDKMLKNGDVFTVDIGMFYDNLHTDFATTILVGNEGSDKIQKFLKVGEETLAKSIEAGRQGGYIGEISKVIEDEIYGHGYHILEELTGHGVGKELHEPPYVPGFLDRPVDKTPKIESGLVIAVEVIYSMGTEDIAHEKGDAWSIVTADGSLSACFERTIGFFEKNRFILT